ncbi:GntR family transcriptional regulator/MocR family aminotransferase [Deinobacterium chartae]|uniref:GntR family transcriptional regulator/MocR family aminotransferase n=1 Tax=Deinobacterium chartae TaxID=521158 RepID=A0A841HUR0_9DEIO|nr:PLP-dependent aminotransferase family protein [Deinobacterium chartae]MBB6097201.1 GntR family transcriptional regulator/MocR family aminotransferase [Deinobacterium chartae]
MALPHPLPEASRVVTLDAAAPDPSRREPLGRQIYRALCDMILSGHLSPGTRLPSTRQLAREWGVSRNTVVNAFEQLTAEGYLEGRVGDGSYVSRELPEGLMGAELRVRQDQGERRLSRRGAALAATPVSLPKPVGSLFSFRPGLPALDAFPFDVWARLEARRWRRPPRELLGYGDPLGWRPLREALRTYLHAARGVRCEPEQIVITAGSQQGLDLVARVLLDPGDPVWVEDPGYLGARAALLAAGARPVPVPVDAQGLRVSDGAARCPDARLAMVTPSHQFPLGATLSVARRLELLEWARHAGAWILEDDYDSEYRYRGRAVAALQGLDSGGRVLYLGTFSKVLLPGLRLGYLVVPPDLVEAFERARALQDRHPPGVVQAVTADFLNEGHFERHLRRTRELYAERQAALLAACQRHLPDRLRISATDAGMHLVGYLEDDLAATERAARAGVAVTPLSAYSLETAGSGLLLGYTALTPEQIEAGVRRLAAALT